MEKFSVDCPYYKKEFDTIEELVEAVINDGVDPCLPLLINGKPTGETVEAYLTF